MFFDYLTSKPQEPPPPKAVYARVDQGGEPETAGKGQAPVLLDCVEAEWLREIGANAQHLSDPDLPQANRRISIIQMPAKHLGHAKTVSGDEPQWYHLELGPPDTAAGVQQFHNLFQDPTERGVISTRPVRPNEAERLNKMAGWPAVSETDPTEIAEVLRRVNHFDTVAIYDVGQGAATALLSNGVPKLYFDLGGSVIGNWGSFPRPLKKFCFTNEPPIVLSHWDWDHWSSAVRDQEALERAWILPIQSEAGALGPVHSRFLAKLKTKAEKICWWPDRILRFHDGQAGYTLFRATGSPKNRNESGLALRLCGHNGDVLLPGDASCANVCQHRWVFDHLMVPHHGGKTDLRRIPKPRCPTTSHLVYSFGTGNIYHHPISATDSAFRAVWGKAVCTSDRDCTGLGHVGIDLTGPSRSRPQLPCPALCQLGIRQWI